MRLVAFIPVIAWCASLSCAPSSEAPDVCACFELAIDDTAAEIVWACDPNGFERSDWVPEIGIGATAPLSAWRIDLPDDPGTVIVSAAVASDTCRADLPLAVVELGPDNLPPFADAGPDQGVDVCSEDRAATLDGSNSYDPEDSLERFEWTVVQGEPGTLFDTDRSMARYLGSTPGIAVIQLVVTDGFGSTASDTARLTLTCGD